MKSLPNIFKRIHAEINNRRYILLEKIKANLPSEPRMNILFSYHPAWKNWIHDGFKFTPHQISFSEISSTHLHNYDLIVPLTINDLKYLNTVRHLIANNPIPIPNLESITLCDNKRHFNQALIANGFGDYIPQMGGVQTYPYILKKSIDEWGANTHVVYDNEQEKALSDLLENPDYFTQTLVSGKYEYATHVLFKNNNIVCALNIEYAFDSATPVKGKNKFIYKKICDCPYLDTFAKILTSIGFEGICCFNYKVLNHRPMIIEINPRFGGSLGDYFFSFIRKIERNASTH